jgi:hypothetical protein
MKFKKINEIWKELEKTNRLPPAWTFLDHPFRNYSSLKMGSQNRISYGHKTLDSLDGTLQTFTLIKI